MTADDTRGLEPPHRTGDRALRIRPLGDRAVIAEVGSVRASGDFEPASPDLATSDATLGLALAISTALGDVIRDIVPAYRSVLVDYDPDRIGFDDLCDAIRLSGRGGWSEGSPLAPRRLVTIPVRYGGDAGPDLDDVAALTGFSPEEVVAAHSGGSAYRVAFLGFSPGYAYLHGLPEQLATPRLDSPRSRVPPGSVAIGGRQTAIYPQATPGGWRLIGRTAVPLFDVGREPAALFQPGDRVVFRAIGQDEHEAIAEAVRRGSYRPDVTLVATGATVPYRRRALTRRRASNTALEVLRPGLLTTVQDGGRSGRGAQGIAPGGALDRAAALAANRLVGNPPDAAVLEMTLTGPTLRASRAATVALTGAQLGALVDDRPAPHREPFLLPAGGTLRFSGELAAPIGVRAYLSVAGGIDVPLVVGGRSTDVTAGFGGLAGRPLAAGDRLPIGDMPVDPRLANITVAPRPELVGSTATLRVVIGPNDDLLAEGDLDRLLAGSYTVSSRSSHMGVRLSGPALRVVGGGELISEGIATGTVQVPADGQPIVLLSGRGTVGGYAKVAGVIDADLDLAAQLRPGTTVRFRAVTLAEAARAGRRYRELLGWLAGRNDGRFPTADPPAVSVRLAAAGLLERARAAIADGQFGAAVTPTGTVARGSGEEPE